VRAALQGFDENHKQRIKIMQALADLKRVESSIANDMKRFLNGIPIYDEFLSRVKGMGGVLSCKLIALPLDIKRDLSSWNAYFGLTPRMWKCKCSSGHKILYPKQPITCRECNSPIEESIEMEQVRRLRGYKSFWSPRAKTLYYLIATSFMKGGGFYKDEYIKYKAKMETTTSLAKGQVLFRALRHTFKLFLAHYYQASCELAGVECRLPYAFEYLNHKDFISWRDVVTSDSKKPNALSGEEK
jgi:hypothetical protein